MESLCATGVEVTLDMVERSEQDSRHVARLFKVIGDKRVHLEEHDQDAQVLLQVSDTPALSHFVSHR